MDGLPKSLVDIAEAEIRKLIVQGDLDLGQRVTESELAKRFGMSKTPVHEALQHLQREGLVQVRPRQGTFIFTFNDELVQALLGVRNVLETFALREAVRKNRGRLLRYLGENLKQTLKIYEEGKIAPYFKLDRAFHFSFFDFADNQFLNAAYSAISIKTQVLWRLTFSSDDYTLADVHLSLEDHQYLVENIHEERLDAACERLTYHMYKTKKNYETFSGIPR